MKISNHITYAEATHSFTAKKKGIDNTPSNEELANMKALAETIFEPLRKWVGGAIKINSFFRNQATNKAVGGSKTSQHCLGQAIDIDDVYGHKTNAEMFWWIVENTDFDQIIWEFGNDNNPDWVHVSYKKDGDNRGTKLRARRVNGKAKYSLM